MYIMAAPVGVVFKSVNGAGWSGVEIILLVQILLAKSQIHFFLLEIHVCLFPPGCFFHHLHIFKLFYKLKKAREATDLLSMSESSLPGRLGRGTLDSSCSIRAELLFKIRVTGTRRAIGGHQRPHHVEHRVVAFVCHTRMHKSVHKNLAELEFGPLKYQFN